MNKLEAADDNTPAEELPINENYQLGEESAGSMVLIVDDNLFNIVAIQSLL